MILFLCIYRCTLSISFIYFLTVIYLKFFPQIKIKGFEHKCFIIISTLKKHFHSGITVFFVPTSVYLFSRSRGRSQRSLNTKCVMIDKFKKIYTNLTLASFQGDYDVVINDYEKAKSLFGNTEVPVFKKGTQIHILLLLSR